MTKNELIEKLNDIEWEDFEVKLANKGLPKSAWESVSAFSNTFGGWLIFGIKDAKDSFEIQGVSNPSKLEHEFLNTLNGDKFNIKLHVKSYKYDFDDKTVLAFYIPASKQKPVYYNALSNTFIRNGSADRRATKEEIDTMYREQSFGVKTSEVIEDMSINDLSNTSLNQYKESIQLANPTSNYNQLNINDWKTYSDIPIEFDTDLDTSKVVFFLKNKNAPVNAPVNALQAKLLALIKQNPNISYDELADKTKKNRTTIMRNIKKLKDNKALERIGSDKTGHWKINQ